MARHLAIGDIHGCISALRTLVDFVALRDDDIIVTLGDYIDRGPDSRAVLDFLIDLGKTHHHVALRGNHEIMMLDARQKKSWLHAWMSYGGEATLRSYAASPDNAGSFADIPESHLCRITSVTPTFSSTRAQMPILHSKIRQTRRSTGKNTRIRHSIALERSWSVATHPNYPACHKAMAIQSVSIPGFTGMDG